MGILINTGFDVGSSSPVDNRTLKDTINERDALVSEGKVYENLKVYCKDTKKEYRWTGTEWETLSGNSSEITYDTLETTDKTIVGAINEVNGNSLDTVGFSVDYKNIILNRKNGLNPYTIPISAIINNAKLIELGDVDSTDIGNGKILAYDSATNKHKYVDSSITDELVKMDGTTDAKYLGELIDKSTVVNDNGVLKVKKLDGQEVTITEINYLKGLTMNVMDLVNAFANGGVKVLNTPLNTASELDTMDRTSFIDGISYIVYVLADENHSGAKTTYLVDKTNTTFFGNADSQRNFTTSPIDLASEVTGKLGTSNIDVDGLWTLLTINDTYKTLTTNNEVFGTHGAKAMYDELVTDIGKKANSDDLTTHANDTDIHTSVTEKASYVKKTDITTTIDNTSTDTQVPSAKAIYNEFSDKMKDFYVYMDSNTALSKYGVDDITNLTSLLSLTSKLNPLSNSRYTIQVHMANKQTFYNCGITPVVESGLLVITIGNYRGKAIFTTDSGSIYVSTTSSSEKDTWSKWRKLCTTSVADVPLTKVTSTVIASNVTNGELRYFVKDGKCYIELDTIKIATIGNAISISTFNFPIPYLNRSCGYKTIQSVKGDKSLLISVDSNGKLNYWANEYNIDGTYFGSISYPVAES